MSAAPAWRSGITGHGEGSPDQLLAHPSSWRIHGKAQREALRAVLDSVGYVAQVIDNQRTGHLVDGHLRVEEALSHGQPFVPVLYVDLSEEEERLVLAGLDSLAAMATTDEANLRELFAEPGLTIEGATDRTSAITHPNVYLELLEHGWGHDEIEAWLAETLTRTLVHPRPWAGELLQEGWGRCQPNLLPPQEPRRGRRVAGPRGAGADHRALPGR